MTDIRSVVSDAFTAWSNGTGYVSSIFADHMTWEIAGHSAASRKYTDRKAFVDEVLTPFGERFSKSDPFRPVKIRGIYVDESAKTAIVIWDGRGTTINDTTYENTYAWILRLENGMVVDGLAFYDSISFNRLWQSVTPGA
jgi:hypothetical protein